MENIELSMAKKFANLYGEVKPYFINSVNPFDGSKDADLLRDFITSNWNNIKGEYDYFFDEEEY